MAQDTLATFAGTADSRSSYQEGARYRMNRLLIVLLLSVSAQAAPLPDAPSATRGQSHNLMLSPFRDPAFYLGVGFHTSSVIADVAHSKRCQLERTCFEANPGADSYGRRSVEIVGVAVASYGCSLMLSEHRRWRWACLAVPVTIGVLHWRDATRIYQVTRR